MLNKNLHRLITKGLRQQVAFKSKGKPKKMRSLELMVLQRVLGAVEGDRASLKYVVKNWPKDLDIELPAFTIEYRDSDGTRLR